MAVAQPELDHKPVADGIAMVIAFDADGFQLELHQIPVIVNRQIRRLRSRHSALSLWFVTDLKWTA